MTKRNIVGGVIALALGCGANAAAVNLGPMPVTAPQAPVDSAEIAAGRMQDMMSGLGFMSNGYFANSWRQRRATEFDAGTIRANQPPQRGYGGFGATLTLEQLPVVTRPLAGNPATDLEGGYFEFLFDVGMPNPASGPTPEAVGLTDIGGLARVLADFEISVTFADAGMAVTRKLVDFDSPGFDASGGKTLGAADLVVLSTDLGGDPMLGHAPEIGLYVPVKTLQAALPGEFDTTKTMNLAWRQPGGSFGGSWMARDCTEELGVLPDHARAEFAGADGTACLGPGSEVFELPLPGGLALMLSGLAGLGFAARLRRRAA